jgi:hypothetical protein
LGEEKSIYPMMNPRQSSGGGTGTGYPAVTSSRKSRQKTITHRPVVIEACREISRPGNNFLRKISGSNDKWQEIFLDRNLPGFFTQIS